MNIRALSSILGNLVLILGFFLILFFFTAQFFYPEENQSVYFLLSALITLGSGGAMRLFGGRLSEENVSYREGFAVAGLGWIIIAFFAAFPAWLSGDIPSYTDAYFESMSGFTTTGASILTDIESLGHTVLLWRSFAHWLGGMGIIVLSLALLPALGIGGMQLYRAEVPGPSPDKLVPRVGETARLLYIVYTMFTAIQFFLLLAGGMNVFESLTHTWGTMGTGGFSPLNSSIGQYAAEGHGSALYFEIVIIIFMFLAGTNFSLHYRLLSGDIRAYFRDPEFKFYLALALMLTAMLTSDLLINSTYNEFGKALRSAGFSAVSILTTTGYGTEDFDSWPTFSRFLLLFIMFIGGSAGSTSGGLKVLRIMTLSKEAFKQFQGTVHPRQIYTVRFGSNHVSKDVLKSMNSFVILFILIYIAGIIILSTTGRDFETISSMVVACLASIGPGLGDVGPTQNYADLPAYAKWVLSYLMVLGRLELLPVMVLMHPDLWKK